MRGGTCSYAVKRGTAKNNDSKVIHEMKHCGKRAGNINPEGGLSVGFDKGLHTPVHARTHTHTHTQSNFHPSVLHQLTAHR